MMGYIRNMAGACMLMMAKNKFIRQQVYLQTASISHLQFPYVIALYTL